MIGPKPFDRVVGFGLRGTAMNDQQPDGAWQIALFGSHGMQEVMPSTPAMEVATAMTTLRMRLHTFLDLGCSMFFGL